MDSLDMTVTTILVLTALLHVGKEVLNILQARRQKTEALQAGPANRQPQP